MRPSETVLMRLWFIRISHMQLTSHNVDVKYEELLLCYIRRIFNHKQVDTRIHITWPNELGGQESQMDNRKFGKTEGRITEFTL